jgi:hypothetical protein
VGTRFFGLGTGYDPTRTSRGSGIPRKFGNDRTWDTRFVLGFGACLHGLTTYNWLSREKNGSRITSCCLFLSINAPKIKICRSVEEEEGKCYSLTLAPLYFDFKLKSNRVWLKLKMDPDPRKKIFRSRFECEYARSSLAAPLRKSRWPFRSSWLLDNILYVCPPAPPEEKIWIKHWCRVFRKSSIHFEWFVSLFELSILIKRKMCIEFDIINCRHRPYYRFFQTIFWNWFSNKSTSFWRTINKHSSKIPVV